jgi:hypothetical protein
LSTSISQAAPKPPPSSARPTIRAPMREARLRTLSRFSADGPPVAAHHSRFRHDNWTAAHRGSMRALPAVPHRIRAL